MNEDKKKLNEEEEAKVSGGAVAKPASNIVNGIDLSACIGCMYCQDFCPTQAISYNEPGGKARIDVNACTRCRLCETNCPTGAIHIDAI